jgi:hypothetical protein
MTLPEIEICEELERALQDKAAAEHKTVDTVVVEVLSDGLGITQRQAKHEINLSGVVGTWVSDPETEAILDEQNRVDPEMWK